MKNYQRKNNFTLIELLIVIAIIAILASMLLPALNKAREKAQTIDCAGNFKQMGAALMMYTSDEDGFLPAIRLDDKENGHWVTFVDRLLPYVKPNGKVWGAMGYYWKDSPFLCRSLMAQDPTFRNTASRNGTIYTCTYTVPGWMDYNPGLTPSYSLARPNKVIKFKSASSKALSCDSQPDSGGYYGKMIGPTSGIWGTKWYGTQVYPIHSKGMNWLYADGHVKWKLYKPTSENTVNAEFDLEWNEQH